MQMTDAIYGAPPVDLGQIDLSPTEMMFWLYCPIKLPGQIGVTMPSNLERFGTLVDAVAADSKKWKPSYVYITAKTLFATAENPGNRPGWHSDGFLTDDLNYIWCDANPTVFFESGEQRFAFVKDHLRSLGEMDDLCQPNRLCWRTYPVKHLLRLDQTVLHKVNTKITPGVRTFVKISVSKHRYALRGNSINHTLAPNWSYQNRGSERNCPITGEATK